MTTWKKWTILATVLGSLGASAGAQAQSRCEAPRVLFVLDNSGSMRAEVPCAAGEGNCPKRYEVARDALAELARSFDGRIEMGLLVFPTVRRACVGGDVLIDVGPRPADELINLLDTLPNPAGGFWTPMAQSLEVAREYGPMQDASRSRHIVLITDGRQECYPYDESDLVARFSPIVEVEALADMGVTVHVVGFGGSVDTLTLNRAAVAGGIAKPGCDPDGTDPADPNNCYDQVDDLAGLRAALDAIARTVTDEVCDGFDNDCDGEVDEGFDQDGDGYTTCGTVPGEPGTLDPGRVDCVDDDPAIYPGADEVCDGFDNDCDGETDPGCECTEGEERPCGSDVGACMQGVQRCEGGRWGYCTGAVTPADRDVCDGRDEDCDGEVDEDGGCPEGYGCHDGECIDLTPPEPPAEDPEPAEPEPEIPVRMDPPPMDGGCACSAPGSVDPASALPGLLLLGLLGWRRRR